MANEPETPNGPAENSGLSERAVVDSLPRAVIATAPDGRILLWNRQAETLYGWTEAEVVGRNIADVLVQVHDRGEGEAIMAAVLAGDTWQGDFTVVRRNGDTVRAFVIDTPVLDRRGAVVAIVGTSEDVTEQRLLEQQRTDLAEHLRLALDAGELGTWRWDMTTGETRWDARLEGIYGLQPGTFDGTFAGYQALIHPDDLQATLRTVQEAIANRARYTVEHRVIWPDGTVHCVQGKGQVVLDAFGDVTGTMGCVSDVTDAFVAAAERERAVELATAAATQEHVSAVRLAFLGEINDALAASLTRDEVMRNVTRVAVPMLGDWCLMHVLPAGGGNVPDMEVAHTDPAMVEYVRALQQRFPYDPESTTGIPQVIRTGTSEFYPYIDDDVLAEVDTTDEARDVVRSLGLRSAIAVPLIKGGRVFGALQFVNAEASRRYTADDLTLAKAVASRIASTLENRRLHEQQREIAATLQASLLPDALPTIEGLELAVRYWAAGEGNTVGGDFYDVFAVDDHWAIVIGDVCGTGPLAASLTGLARHTIRAAAWNDADPDDVLRQLNHAVRRSGRQTFCTALYGALIKTDKGFRLTVAAGGHPLPIVHRADGHCETIGIPGTVLGGVAESRSTTVSTELDSGDIAVFYTDGVTDVRPPHDLTPDALEELVAHAAIGTTAEEVITNLGYRIDARLPFTQRNDDIALLVLKVR